MSILKRTKSQKIVSGSCVRICPKPLLTARTIPPFLDGRELLPHALSVNARWKEHTMTSAFEEWSTFVSPKADDRAQFLLVVAKEGWQLVRLELQGSMPWMHLRRPKREPGPEMDPALG